MSLMRRIARRLRGSARRLDALKEQRKSARAQLSELAPEAGALAIDCGANVGDITEILCSKGAEVHAYEPNSSAFSVLEERFDSNSLVQCHRAAVGTSQGQATLFLHDYAEQDPVKWSNGSSLLADKRNVDASGGESVEVIDLAAHILSLGRRVALLKMDIEGAECDVLLDLIERGAIDKVDLALVEMHDEKIPSLVEPARRLRERIQSAGLTQVRLDWF